MAWIWANNEAYARCSCMFAHGCKEGKKEREKEEEEEEEEYNVLQSPGMTMQCKYARKAVDIV